MNFENIKLAVNGLGDGRSYSDTKHKNWIKRVRDSVVADFQVGGFNGLYFLYKEATVSGGSVANQDKYAVPDDFVEDLNVFYDGELLAKSTPGILEITIELDETSETPTWVELRGQEFKLRPIPTVAGDEIKLFYNALPDTIISSSQEDHFMKLFPDLHIYGMGVYLFEEMGDIKAAVYYKNSLQEEKARLRLHNRRWYTKNARLRFQNWDEYQDKKTLVFPQFVSG